MNWTNVPSEYSLTNRDIRHGCWQFADIRQFQDLAAAVPMGRDYYRTLINFDKSAKGGRSMPVISLLCHCRWHQDADAYMCIRAHVHTVVQTRTCAADDTVVAHLALSLNMKRMVSTCKNKLSNESASTYGSDLISTG